MIASRTALQSLNHVISTEAAPLQENKSVYFPVQEKPKENGFKRQKEKVVSPDANVTVMHRSESAESFNSLYSEPCGQDDYAIRGKLKVGVWYKRTEEQLYVRVHSAEGLKEDGTSNSYVKINLLPEKNKQTKQKTDIQTKTTKPTYNEILKVCSVHFSIPGGILGLDILAYSVWRPFRILGLDILAYLAWICLSCESLGSTYFYADKCVGTLTVSEPTYNFHPSLGSTVGV